MRVRNRYIAILICSVVIFTSIPMIHAIAQIEFEPEIHIKRDCDSSEAELVIRATIPMGTPIGSLTSAMEQILSFYRDLWSGDDSILNKVLPLNDTLKASDVKNSFKAVCGIDLLMLMNRAFREVEEKGMTSFPSSVSLISRETIPLFEECLLTGSQKSSAPRKASSVQERIPSYRSKNLTEIRRKQISANLNNLAISLLSFRSEFGRFPASFDELKSKGHLLIQPINPFTGDILKLKNEMGPGTFTYTKPSEEKYIITVFDENNLPIRRELITRPEIPVRGALSVNSPSGSKNKPFTQKEQVIRIYVFQVGQLVNSFYETFNYLPRNLSHIEAQGFASLSFINPFTGKPIRPSERLDKGSPGTYYYIVLGNDEYILGGYGEGGRKVMEVHRKFMANIDSK